MRKLITLVVLAGALLALVGVAGAGATGDKHPSVDVGGDCGAPTLTFNNPTHHKAYFRYTEDGVQSDVLTVGKYDQVEKDFGPYEEDSEHTLSYQILDGNPQTTDEEVVDVPVDTDCVEEPPSSTVPDTTTTSSTVPDTTTTTVQVPGTQPDTLTCADLPANIPVGSPAYSPDLDQDGDGIACETPVAAPASPVVTQPTFTG